VREKIRLEKLATYRETGVWPVAKADAAPVKKKEAWSEKKEQKSKKKEKKQLKQEIKNKKKKRKIDQDEWNELAHDAHLMKKLKKKKVCFLFFGRFHSIALDVDIISFLFTDKRYRFREGI